jgi:hypothetical protein
MGEGIRFIATAGAPLAKECTCPAQAIVDGIAISGRKGVLHVGCGGIVPPKIVKEIQKIQNGQNG